MTGHVPPFLTDDEIAEICRPLRQGAAQIRYLKSIGVRVERRPDGRPLVLRARLEPAGNAPTQEPNWRKATPGRGS